MRSVRISPQLEETVRRTAAQKGITRSELFRQALESYCSAESAPPASSRFDDIIGVVDVPGDFSTYRLQGSRPFVLLGPRSLP